MPLLRFFSFDGRTGRSGWALWLAVFCAVLVAGTIAFVRIGSVPLTVFCALLGLTAAKLTTQTVRRVHDCGRSGWIGFAACVGILTLLAAAAVCWLGDGAQFMVWGLIVVAGAAAAVLFLHPGEKCANRYGPGPAPSRPDAARPSPIGAIAAVLWVAAGIAFGIGALSWQAGMDRQREERMRMADPPPPPPAAASRPTGTDTDNEALSNRIDTLLEAEPTR